MIVLGLIGLGTSIYAESEPTYREYMEHHRLAPQASTSIVIEGEDEVTGQGLIKQNSEGRQGKAVLMEDTGHGTWRFNVRDEGLYALKIDYYPIEGKSAPIERRLYIDGELPFEEAGNLLFSRIWGNKTEEIIKDINDNELRPLQVEKPRWCQVYVEDTSGYFKEPYLFYLTQGEHELTLESIKEPMLIDTITFTPYKAPEPYEKVKNAYKKAGYEAVKNVRLTVEGERAIEKSSPTLYPLNDRTSPLTQPYHHTKIRMNTIGGYNWRVPGDWITWEVDVPEDGLYKLDMRCKQNFLRGIYATRALLIDGQVPFEEAGQFKFYYTKDFDMYSFADEDGEAYSFYLTKGTHEITLKIGLGDLGQIFGEAEKSLEELNMIYRNIIMITGNVPDRFRDYQLDKQIPALALILEELEEDLHRIATGLESITGEKSDQTVILSKLQYQVADFRRNMDSIPSRLDDFKSNISSLGSWVVYTKEQPLEIDYLMVSSIDEKMPRTKANFWEKTKHLVMGFLASFTEDYTQLGLTKEMTSNEKIKVWIGVGRDQANVLRIMIDEMFTPATGIQVDLQLVGQTVLLPATLGGRGPDVAIQVTNDIPVNYAMRNAVYDLSQFPDFEDVKKRFRKSSFVPYTYDEGIYALPDQQWFPMLFYRKSILEELGVGVPQTWEDVIEMIPDLQKHNLEFYLELETEIQRAKRQTVAMPVNTVFSALLYQQGGQFYTDDRKRSALDYKIAMEAFKTWSEFYTSYKLPIQSNFSNRFRTGETPIGIVDYSYYNTLMVFAPDIRGDWDFSPLPGTRQSDGTIDRSVGGSGLGTVLLNGSKSKNAAWVFMKWWTKKETQVRFGREMEGILGAAARYPTANVEALKELPWPLEDYKAINAQWEWVQGIPEVPGGYLTGRYLDNALKKVIDDGTNPRDSLYEYVDMINTELAIKQREFGGR